MGGAASSRDIGRFLQSQTINGSSLDALTLLKQRHAGLRAFFQVINR